MKLDKVDKAYLEVCGFSDGDFPLIEAACRRTKYFSLSSGWPYKKITAKEAEKVLGRKLFVSGLARSALHSSAVRENDNGGKVLFDSSSMFRN